jgi:tripartite-type tricarboxylate transporter receptor subunit TctC
MQSEKRRPRRRATVASAEKAGILRAKGRLFGGLAQLAPNERRSLKEGNSMRHLLKLTGSAGALALVVAIAAAPSARAESVADFYKGKTVTILVGFGSGGGYDTTVRLFAPVFEKHIPGHPTVVVQNMPGAGSMKVANYMWEVAPKDGSTLGLFASSTALEPLFGDKRAHYDPRKYQWIGSLTSDIASCGVWKGAGQGIKTLPDLIKAKKTVTFGSTSPTAITSQHALFLKHMFGANVKVIYGYKGTHDVSLAMQRGEVNGSCGMFESSVRGAFDQWVKAGDFKIIVQFGRDRKVPYFGDATQMYTMLKTADEKKVADVIFRQTELARPLAAPPGTPKDRVAALRKAMLDTIKDPAMVADAKKRQVDFDPVPGEEAAAIFASFYQTPPALIKQARTYTEPDPN